MVAILGMGVVSPAGTGVRALWNGLCSGRSFARRLPVEVAGLPLIGHVVPDGEWAACVSTSEARRLDRFTLLGMAAATEAVSAARSLWDGVAPARRAVVTGVGFGGITTLTHQHDVLRERGWRRLSPFGVVAVMSTSLAGLASMKLDARGPVSTVSSACASGTHALIDGARLIVDGSADIVLAGGAEAPLDALPMSSFARMEAMNWRAADPAAASRPFDVDRTGFVLGEGAAFMVLASDDLAHTSGLPVLGTIDGWALTSDAHHPTAPQPNGDGSERAMRQALAMAAVRPAEVAHVNAHGTGTKLNDAAEARALTTVFGSSVPVTSVKGTLGHLMGAAGAVEAVACLVAARDGVVPPTVNCDELDGDMEIDVVMGGVRSVPIGPAVSCSFGFGGQNAAIVMSPAQGRGAS